MPTLTINVDEIAALRQIRGGKDPDPVQIAILAELAGAQAVTGTFREGGDFLKEKDVYLLKQTLSTIFNLRTPPTTDNLGFAVDILPHIITFIPEHHEDKAAQAGYSVRQKEKDTREKIESLLDHGVKVSLFIDPDIGDLKAAKRVGADLVEINTNYYANAAGQAKIDELAKIKEIVYTAQKIGLTTLCGGGLNYKNISHISAIDTIRSITVGHCIISRAVANGIDQAVRDLIAQIT